MNKKSKSGRPNGRKTTYTHPDKDLHDNLQLAFWGLDDGNPATAFMHQLWISRNPSEEHLCRMAKALKTTPEKVLSDILAQRSIEPPISDWIIDAVDSGDWEFFECAARVLKKCHESLKGQLHADDPYAKAISLFVIKRREEDPDATFTVTSILDGAEWGGNGCPDRKTVGEKATQLGIELQPGKPGRPRGS